MRHIGGKLDIIFSIFYIRRVHFEKKPTVLLFELFFLFLQSCSILEGDGGFTSITRVTKSVHVSSNSGKNQRDSKRYII